MRKFWEFIALLFVGAIALTIAVEAVTPYLPVIGAAVAVIIVATVAILAWRVLSSRSKFW